MKNRFNLSEAEAREVKKENLLARLLGPDVSNGKLIAFGDATNAGERIGNWDKIHEYAKGIHERSKDYNATLKDLICVTNPIVLPGGETFENIAMNISTIEEEANPFSFSANGLRGICTQLDIPVAYIRKCLDESQSYHASDCINFWIDNAKAQEKKILLRTTDERIHGVLSSKYSVFDDSEVMDVVYDLIGKNPGEYTVKNYYIDPEYMKLRIVSTNKMNFAGRELSYGFDIRNSRVGRSSLEVSIIIFDWICSNGMIFGGGSGTYYQKRHVGIEREHFVEEFIDIIDTAPDAVSFIHKSINAANNVKLNSDTIQNYIDKFMASNMSANQAGRVKQMFYEKYDQTLFGFTGAITETAQAYGIETRERMERFAGNLIHSLGKKMA